MFVAMLLVAGVSFASVAGNIQFGGDPQPAADVARQLPELANPILLVAGALTAVLLIASTSVVALQTGSVAPVACVVGLRSGVCLALLGAVAFHWFAATVGHSCGRGADSQGALNRVRKPALPQS